MAVLEQLFKELESPFVWGLASNLDGDWGGHARRLRDLLLVPDSAWTTAVLRLNLSWLLFKRGDSEASRAQLVEVHTLLGTLGWTEAAGGLLQRCEAAVEHAVQAAWAHLTHTHTPLSDMQAELMEITPEGRLGSRQRAALFGLQASCLYYLCVGITLKLLAVQGEKMGKKMISAARKASELCPEEAEWQLLKGKKHAAALEGDAFTPHTAVYTATRHVYCKEALPARVLLRRALDSWPDNAYVQLSAAYLYGQLGELRLAEQSSLSALRLAPQCVLVHLVRRTLHAQHSSPCLSRCAKTYGLSLEEAIAKLRGSCFVLEGIICGFVSGRRSPK